MKLFFARVYATFDRDSSIKNFSLSTAIVSRMVSLFFSPQNPSMLVILDQPATGSCLKPNQRLCLQSRIRSWKRHTGRAGWHPGRYSIQVRYFTVISSKISMSLVAWTKILDLCPTPTLHGAAPQGSALRMRSSFFLQVLK